jgi:protoheme IX farnesyltransferase
MTMANPRLASDLASPVVARAIARARDLAALTKPRVTLLVVWTAGAGALTAPGRRPAWTTAAAIAGTTLIVAAANALNMWVERDVDARMARTRRRPLPAGRMEPATALAFGCALAALAVPLLCLSNALTALLGLAALGIYVGAYTPLKRVTCLALWVGAVPGAIPPLLGRTSVTGRIDGAGLAIFALLFLWQLLHFAAISLFREREYREAGFVVLSVSRGPVATRRVILASAVALVPASLALFVVGVAGPIYAAAAALGGAAMLWSVVGAPGAGDLGWARRTFIASNAYLACLLLALCIDRVVP